MSNPHTIQRDLYTAMEVDVGLDPGNAGTFVVNRHGQHFPLVSAGAETRTLPAPTVGGVEVLLHMMTDGGDITVTITGGYNEDGETTFVFSDPGQFLLLRSVRASSTTFVWRKVADYASTNLSLTEAGYLNGITPGTGAASKAVILDASGNFSMPTAGIFAMSRATIAAAGVDATDATVLTGQFNAVTGADAAKGVALPAAATTTGPIWVQNTVLTSGGDLKVYPVNGGNDQINGEAEDAAVVMGPGRGAWFIPTSGTQWYVSDQALTLTTKAEENILDGVTATAAELNYSDASLATNLLTQGTGVDGAEAGYAAGIERHGSLIVTRILVNIDDLIGSGTDLDIIGESAAANCTWGQITAAKSGTIIGGRITCLEVPAGGTDDIDFYSSNVATGTQDVIITDAALGTETALVTSGGSWTLGLTKALSGLPTANDYLYIVNGAAAGGTFSAGKFLIELFGV